ncbi:MAG: DUF4304 domain-containing protein [Gammaproteobacteria bacterium]|nr:DUF4304 domain-containing protein [Gammaproteobacteria bacterium]
MNALVSKFFTELHKTAMKPMGFRKERHRFSRPQDGYVEIVDFQGSSWNQAEGPWLFYINIAVGFEGIEAKGQKLWFNVAHAMGRIEGLVPGSNTQYSLSESSFSELLKRIPILVETASKALPSFLPRAEQRAMAGLLSPLPVPENWKTET